MSVSSDPAWVCRFESLERDFLASQPWRAKQDFCCLIAEDDRLTSKVIKRVKLSCGHVLYSAWYEEQGRTRSGKLRSFDSWLREAKRATKENEWLIKNQP